MYDYVLGGLLGASIALLGTVAAANYTERQPTPVKVTLVGEPVEAPESPVEAPEPQEVLPAIEDEETLARRSPARRRLNRRYKVTIDLESDDPLEGI